MWRMDAPYSPPNAHAGGCCRAEQLGATSASTSASTALVTITPGISETEREREREREKELCVCVCEVCFAPSCDNLLKSSMEILNCKARTETSEAANGLRVFLVTLKAATTEKKEGGGARE